MAFVGSIQSTEAAAPASYYSSCEGRTGQSLLTALSGVVSNHTTVSYSGLWTLYKTSDTRANGTIWDMYSTKEYRYKTDQCGSYSAVGSCYNREHSFPKSWFNDASPMVSDAFHIYPTDGKVNGQRSNYPYGECAGGTTLPASGGIKALGRLGKSTFPGYSGTVFEPDDEYKGDFARSYFYMATAYNSRISSWKSDMLAGNNYPVFSTWALNLLLKWHRQDPVSDKEINRNDAVYAQQKNRNPFIDHPELVEYIWGDKKGESWYASGSQNPVLTLPANGSSVNIGATVPGFARTATINIKGSALTGNVTISASGTGFSVSPTQITASAANQGTSATVTFNPQAAGSYTGSVTISCGSISSKVNLFGSAITTLPAGPVTTIGEDSFIAVWSNVGDADSRGEYTLDVQYNGVSLDEYPRSVAASDESFIVEDLEPSTTYTYVIKSAHLVSDIVSVTTLEPQPLIEFLFDGELNFSTAPGAPSEAAELLVNAYNIDSDITVSVSSPFEISTDKSNWSTSLTLDPEEDRLYLRLNSPTPGFFRTSIIASADGYFNDNAEAEGTAADVTTIYEDFEPTDDAGTYSAHQYIGSAGVWNFTDAGIWPVKSEAYTGNQALRLGKTSTSSIEMAEMHNGGIGVVRFHAKRYNKDPEAELELLYTTDGGNTWHPAGTAKVEDTSYKEFSFIVNIASPARLRIAQKSGERVNIDDIEATNFSGLVPDEVADYHRWDAFCRDGLLMIEAATEVTAGIYALDGTVVFSGTVKAGEATFELPAGLYIVAVDNFARRVLVK